MIELIRQLLAIILSAALVVPACAESKTTVGDPNSVNGAASYVYDNVGNRTQKTSTIPGYPGGLTNYNANDELATDAYDANGNTTGSGTNTGTNGYIYDFENHLIQQGAGISIVYDGDGNRVSKTVGGVTTTYLVDTENPTGYAQVLQDTITITGNPGPNFEVNRTYVYGLERISQRRYFIQNYQSVYQNAYYVYDGHGSVRALTDKTGTVTDTYDYDAFGNLIHSTGTTPNNYLYSGEQFDPDLGMYFLRARYLNVSTGRFWSMDSFEGLHDQPFSLHKYLYARANPVDRRDPSGKQDEIEEVAAEGIGEELDSNIAAGAEQQGAAATDLVGEAEADVAESAAPAEEGEAAEAATENPLKITDKGLKHVLERHVPGGARTAGKSVFNAGEDIRGLLQAGENTNPVQQLGGNFQRVIDAGREIGIDRATGAATQVYTIITNAAGEVVTAFPGLPIP